MADNKESRGVFLKGVTENSCGNDACYCTGYCKGENVQRDSPNLLVKVSADVGEAITGFKALQRELRETTKDFRELERAAEEVGETTAKSTSRVSEALSVLSEFSTKELHEELAKREGVKEFVIGNPGNYAKLSVNTDDKGYVEFIEGPARIIVNLD